MKIDNKLKELPLTKSNPRTLESLFGKTDIQPFWVADMEFEIAKPIQDALIQRISNSGFAYEYKPESFFLAQKDWYKNKYQIGLNKEHLLYSPSITTTISILIENLTSENDGIIIQPPVFMEFRDVIRKTNRKIIKNPLKLVDRHYEIDFENLEEKAKLENNKILILCNPHNPVGRVWTKEELEKIIAICKENDLILISDEIHKDIILFDNQFNSILNYTEKWKNRILWVDDRPENNVYERKAFESQGIEFSLALSTNEALEILKTDKYAAIISDMGRKEGPQEGYILLEKIRKSGDQTPFFVYAGSNAPEHKMMALERGAQGSTNRPQELYEMVMNRISNG